MKNKRLRKKENYSLFQGYKETWEFLKESKYYLLSVILVFCIFFAIGFFVPIPELVMNMIKEWISQVLKETEGLGFFGMWWFIFSNNLSIAFLAIFLGLFFGLFPALSLAFNAYFVGAVTSMVVEKTNITEVWRLLPHGIFELPAIFISFAVGIRLGIDLMINCLLFYKKELPRIPLSIYVIICLLFFPIIFLIILILTILNKSLRNKLSFNFFNSIRVFIFIIIPLLLIASFIEAGLIVFLK